MKKTLLAIFITTAFLFGTAAVAQIAVLSGAKQGSYYQFVNDMANALNSDSVSLINNTITEGAAVNLDYITDPSSPYKIGLIQEDYLYYMQNQDLIQNTKKVKNIKVVMPLANEEIHLVTLQSSGIKSLRDITDSTRIAIGKRSQGTYTTASQIKDRTGIFWKSIPVHYEDALRMLLRKEIDAFFVVGSAPINKLNLNPQALQSEFLLVPLEDFNDWAKFYDSDVIKAGTYKWLENDVPTYSVQSLLVVNESKLTAEDREMIRKISSGLSDNFQTLRTSGHPKWSEIELSDREKTDWPVFKNE
jgi:TRAP transporter TAXI family solute receptor